MRKIKIGFFGTRGLGNYGGFETIVKEISENLSYEQFSLYVSREVNQKQEYMVEKIKTDCYYINQKKTKLSQLKDEVDNVINEAKILNDLYSGKIEDLDVVFQCASTPGFFMKKPLNDRSILLWNPDGLEWRRDKWSVPIKILWYLSTYFGIKKSHAVTVDSRAIGNDIKYMFKKNQPVYFLPSGTNLISEEEIDEKYLEEYSLKKENYYIVVGRSVPENNILEIISYFLKADTDKKLIVVANFSKDKYSKKCLKIIQDNSQKIIYKGPIYDQKKLKSLRYFAYAYIHGHSVGGTNPSLLEALGAGNPCICYDVPYNKEVSGLAGVYFKNLVQFKECILSLENKTEKEINNIKKIAVNIIEKNYKWDYITELHEGVLMSILLKNEKISQEIFDNWLLRKKYKDKLIKDKFNRIE